MGSIFGPSGSSLSRIRSSRRPTTEDDDLSNLPKGLVQATALLELVDTINRRQLPGPLDLFRKPDDIDVQPPLGMGAQFVVREKEILIPCHQEGDKPFLPVAAKFPKLDLDPNQPLSYTSSETKRHFRSICIEIKALTTPLLSRHPNIVRLLTWSIQHGEVIHKPLCLVMELALSDMETFLSERGPTTMIWQKYVFVADIAAGLDAIHACKLVHGDLKPANVLVFVQNNRHVAKLGDFGMTLDDEGEEPIGGTPGWMAPEVARGERLSGQQLYRTDNYSFGLVAATIFLGTCITRSAPLPHDVRPTVHACFTQIKDALDQVDLPADELMAHICSALHPQSSSRPGTLENLFQLHRDPRRSSFTHQIYLKSEFQSRDYHYDEVVSVLRKSLVFPPAHQWEDQKFPIHFKDDMQLVYREDPESLSAGCLHVMSLWETTYHQQEDGSSSLDFLLSAARAGSSPAKAAVPDVFEFFGKSPSPADVPKMAHWLRTAVSDGSTAAKSRLRNTIGPSAVDECLVSFRNRGGYAHCYKYHIYTPPGRDPWTATLHRLAGYGRHQEMDEFLNLMASREDFDIEQKTENGETALYIACARGAWQVANTLLDRGASARAKCTGYGISCIHWVFALDDNDQSKAIKRLVASGVDLDATAERPVPLMHYPYLLPTGTALHWAVATSSHSAVRALVENGADLSIRDASDPYKHDLRVREADFGSSELDIYSLLNVAPKGLSALDYAAMDHDPYIFELLLTRTTRAINFDINSVDEEGFTVLHRLSHYPIRRTRTRIGFSFLPFKGSMADTCERLHRTIAAIKALGGDLEALSTPAPTSLNPNGTPLSMAVAAGLPYVARALLAAGASIHTTTTLRHSTNHIFNEESTALLEGLSNIEPILQLEMWRMVISSAANMDLGIDLNTKDEHGRSLLSWGLWQASQCLDTIELLLSHGADVCDRRRKDAHNKGFSIFAEIGNHAPSDRDRVTYTTSDDNRDRRVADLLERFVFLPEPYSKKHVMNFSNRNGRTALHQFAQNGWPHCVNKLIQHDAAVNPVQMREDRKHIREGGKPVRTQVLNWRETPLDIAVRFHQRKIRERQVVALHSLAEYDIILGRYCNVINALKGAGGVSMTEEDVKSVGVEGWIQGSVT